MCDAMRTRVLSPGRRFWSLGLLIVGAALILSTVGRPLCLHAQLAYMSEQRQWATATTLNDGTVLIVGGQGKSGPLASAELYIPNADGSLGHFVLTGSMSTARINHIAILLRDGRVLVTGGEASSGPIKTAEVYDPSTGTFTLTGSMNAARTGHRALALPYGRILVTGGFEHTNLSAPALSSAEMYDPTTGTFTPAASMKYPRGDHGMALLENGKVLVTGGLPGIVGNPQKTSEIYDPASGQFSEIQSMNAPRNTFTLTVLNGGKVLAAGGNTFADAEIFDPETDNWTSLSANCWLKSNPDTATLLTSGEVLFAGKLQFNVSQTWLFNPVTMKCSSGPSTTDFRYGHVARLLTEGKVLLAGGANNTAELYSPAQLSPDGLLSISADALNSVKMRQTPTVRYQATGTYDDGTKHILHGVIWSTTEPEVASISNDESDRGIAFLGGKDTTTLLACAGEVCSDPVYLGKPEMTSPAPGRTLPPGSTVTFAWDPRAGSSYFRLALGTTAKGSSDVYNGQVTTATSVQVSSIPTNGAPLYARLYYQMRGIWYWIDYTYTEAGTPTPPVLKTPAPGSKLPGATVTFTWDPGKGPTVYRFKLGTTGPGSFDVYDSGETKGTSVTVSGVPTYGVILYAQLAYEVGTLWTRLPYTYTEAGTPVLPEPWSPTPGSTLSGSTVTFTWKPGEGATQFRFTLGTKGEGSSDVYNGPVTTATSVQVSSIPTNGAPLNARLYYKLSGIWYWIPYTYIEAGTPTPPVLTTPPPGTTLAGSSVVFTWTPGKGPSMYRFKLGTTGSGSADVYDSGEISSTSTTVAGIPANGAPLYAQLAYKVGTVWTRLHYNYTEGDAPLGRAPEREVSNR